MLWCVCVDLAGAHHSRYHSPRNSLLFPLVSLLPPPVSLASVQLHCFRSACPTLTMAATDSHIGIIGSGLIGKSWAMIFASVGYKVFFLLQCGFRWCCT